MIAVADLVEVDQDEAGRRIATACGAVADVVAAYLFGSALGRCRPDSDIEVGVIRRSAMGEASGYSFSAGLRMEAELIEALGTLAGHRFDVTDLDPARPIFVMTVLRTGRLAYVADPEIYTDFLEVVAQGYRENGPRFEAALDEVLEEPLASRER